MSTSSAASTPAAPPDVHTPVDWMRIFAARLAQQRSELSPEQVIQVAISEFRLLHRVAPEEAATLCAGRRWLQA